MFDSDTVFTSNTVFTSIKKVENKNIKYQSFFDEIKKAKIVYCGWEYDPVYNKTILEVFLINFFEGYNREHYIISNFNYEILEALEKKGCRWDCILHGMKGYLSTTEELDADISIKLRFFAKCDNYEEYDNDVAIFKRIMDNLPDNENYSYSL